MGDHGEDSYKNEEDGHENYGNSKVKRMTKIVDIMKKTVTMDMKTEIFMVDMMKKTAKMAMKTKIAMMTMIRTKISVMVMTKMNAMMVMTKKKVLMM